MMRAAVLEAPGRVVRQEVEEHVPGPADLLAAVEAGGLGSSEIDLYLGRNPWASCPVRPGHEVTGRCWWLALTPAATGSAGVWLL